MARCAGQVQIGGQVILGAKHPGAPARAAPAAGERKHPVARDARLGLLDAVGRDRAIEFMDGPGIAARLCPHGRKRNALVPVGAFQAHHRLLGKAGEAKLAKDLAQLLVALRERRIDPLHTMLGSAGTEHFEDAKPDIGVGGLAVAIAIGRQHHDILLGPTVAPNRLDGRARARLAVDEGGSITPAALEKAAQTKPERAMWLGQHRLVIQHHLAARLPSQYQQVTGCEGSYHRTRYEF